MDFEQQLQSIMATLKVVVDLQERQAKSGLELSEAITRYVDSSTARMAQLEANLDALIRAITADHSNGKGKV